MKQTETKKTSVGDLATLLGTTVAALDAAKEAYDTAAAKLQTASKAYDAAVADVEAVQGQIAQLLAEKLPANAGGSRLRQAS